MKNFHIWNQIGSFEPATLLQKWLINFEQNGGCDQKMLQIKYFKIYIIWFYFRVDGYLQNEYGLHPTQNSSFSAKNGVSSQNGQNGSGGITEAEYSKNHSIFLKHCTFARNPFIPSSLSMSPSEEGTVKTRFWNTRYLVCDKSAVGKIYRVRQCYCHPLYKPYF